MIAAGCLALITMGSRKKVTQAYQTPERREERMSDKINGQEVHPMVLELASGQNFGHSLLCYPVATRRRR